MKFLILLCSAIILQAQQISQDPARNAIHGEGQIFAIRIVPALGRVEIRFVDAPLVTLDAERIAVVATARGVDKGSLEIEENSGELRLSRPLAPDTLYEFRIRDKVTNKAETVRVKMKGRP